MCCLFYVLFLIKDTNVVIVSLHGTPMEFLKSISRDIKRCGSTLASGLLRLNYSRGLKISKYHLPSLMLLMLKVNTVYAMPKQQRM